MALSSELVSQFAKITNDETKKSTEETRLYGTVVQYENTLCVKLDGTDELTPAVTTSTVKAGERVAVSIKNHTAIITGNITDPSASSDELNGIKTTATSIEARVGAVEVAITEMGVSITGLVTVESLSNGTTTIDGACIKTGTIDADRLNLTGAITFEDLSQTVQDDINSAASAADAATTAANNATKAAGDASSAAGEALLAAEEARDIAESITIPNYIKSTYIGPTEIRSPSIAGNDISVYGTFRTIGYDGVSEITTGYMGAAKGMDALGNDTFGVALSYTWDEDDYSIGNNYIIVTNGGCRMQAGSHKLVVTSNGAFYDGKEIATV